MKKRLVVGMSGATGAIYGIRLLETLANSNIETHLVISDAPERPSTWKPIGRWTM